MPDFKIERYLTKRQKDGKMPVICDTVQLQNSDKSIRLADLQPDGSVLVECTDFGPGMSPEQLLQLFGEGVQFSPNELQAGGGSGLGLWISKVNNLTCCYYFTLSDLYFSYRAWLSCTKVGYMLNLLD